MIVFSKRDENDLLLFEFFNAILSSSSFFITVLEESEKPSEIGPVVSVNPSPQESEDCAFTASPSLFVILSSLTESIAPIVPPPSETSDNERTNFDDLVSCQSNIISII